MPYAWKFSLDKNFTNVGITEISDQINLCQIKYGKDCNAGKNIRNRQKFLGIDTQYRQRAGLLIPECVHNL